MENPESGVPVPPVIATSFSYKIVDGLTSILAVLTHWATIKYYPFMEVERLLNGASSSACRRSMGTACLAAGRRGESDPTIHLGQRRLLRSMAKRGHRNRLGFAVQLCFMRFPGRPLSPGEEVPQSLLHFVGEQLAVSPAVFADYARRDQTRREHAVEFKNISVCTQRRVRIDGPRS